MSESEATSPVAEEALAPATETGVAPEAEAQSDDQGGEFEEGDDAPTEDELEEIELHGKKYSVHKELAKELNEGSLRQKDYTQKTQSVAERAKALEARETEIAQQAEAVTALRADYGKIHALQQQVDYYGNVDWQAYVQQNPQGSQADWMAYQQAKEMLRDASEDVTKKEGDLRSARERDIATARANTNSALAKDVKGWGPELANKLADFAEANLGVSRDELRGVDARTWKLVNLAFEGQQLKTKQAATQRQTKIQEVQPAVSVRGSAPSSNAPSDKDSADVWLRKRNAQLAKQAAR